MIEIQIRSYCTEDAEQVAEIIQRCLRQVNSRDYPPQVIDKLCAHYSTERFTKLSGSRQIYVAEADAVVGTVSRDGNKVYTMFVDPNCAGNGIGRRLMQHLEHLASEDGYDYVEAGASITAHDFYLSLSYFDVRESETDLGLTYIMRKSLR